MLSRKQWKSFCFFLQLKKKKAFESALVNKQSNNLHEFHKLPWLTVTVLWPCSNDFTFWNLSFVIYSADDNTSYTGLLLQFNGMLVKSTQQSDWHLESPHHHSKS